MREYPARRGLLYPLRALGARLNVMELLRPVLQDRLHESGLIVRNSRQIEVETVPRYREVAPSSGNHHTHALDAVLRNPEDLSSTSSIVHQPPQPHDAEPLTRKRCWLSGAPRPIAVRRRRLIHRAAQEGKAHILAATCRNRDKPRVELTQVRPENPPLRSVARCNSDVLLHVRKLSLRSCWIARPEHPEQVRRSGAPVTRRAARQRERET